MQIHLYTICWNEADILPFFFRHYDPWVNRYVVYDNGSSDESLDILAKHPGVELRQFPWSNPDSFVLSQQNLYNQTWKESRGSADWVVITAIDEHLHVPGKEMLDYIDRCSRAAVTCVPALGFQMVSEEFPEPHETLCLTRTRGAPWRHMSKLSLFDPNAVKETCYKDGRHKAHPSGRVIYPERDELLLLHYKLIGFERSYRHNSRELSGLRSYDHAQNWQRLYEFSREQFRRHWNRFARNAVDLSDPKLRPWIDHREKRWWRSKRFNLVNQIVQKFHQIRSRSSR